MEIIIPEPAAKKFKIYGESVALTEPTVDQVIDLQMVNEGESNAGKLKAMKALSISLGMPELLAGKLKLADFTTIISTLTGADKKK